MKAKKQVTAQERINHDRNMDALEELADAIEKYENATGHTVTDMKIRNGKEKIPAEPVYDHHNSEEHINTFGTPEPLDYDQAKKYIDQKVVEPILTMFPISTPNTQQCNAEFNCMDENMFNTFSECRYHDDLIAYAVGQIAYATTAMLLEYQTQKMAHVEMCRVVDKDDKARYIAPDSTEF